MTITKRYPQTILATACIPWDEQAQFAEAIFRHQVRGLIKRGIRHIYLFGTAGEGYAVTDKQYEHIVKTFAEEMSGSDLYPMVGVMSLSLPIMQERIRTAYEMGIRDFQFSFPSWGALEDAEVVNFMHELCDPYPDCRFFHYNLLRSKRLLTMPDFVRLAEQFPNFCGVKFSTTDLKIVHDMIESECPLQFFITEMGYCYAHIVGGSCGMLLSMGSSNISRAKACHQAASTRDYEQLAAFSREFYGLYRSIIEAIGTPRIDGAYDKAFTKLVDPDFPLRLLPPYVSCTEQQFAAYKRGLQQKYPQWLEA